jgi:hypothetical protein
MSRLCLILSTAVVLSVYGNTPEIAAATEKTPVQTAQPDDQQEEDEGNQDGDVIIMEDDDDPSDDSQDQDSD